MENALQAFARWADRQHPGVFEYPGRTIAGEASKTPYPGPGTVHRTLNAIFVQSLKGMDS